MDLSREAVVEHLQQILGPENVDTDEGVLRERSIGRV
jgi:DNA polymerase III gamma/tau subunit